jgi:hypothetical protein
MTTIIANGNSQRAAYAHELLSGSEHHDATEPSGVQDLLSDLMHLCERNDWDFAELLRVATDNFNAELLDPECNSKNMEDLCQPTK